MDKFFFYPEYGSRNIIYNKITDSLTNVSCYPDILYDHPYEEGEITGHEIYEIVSKAISLYGSSRVVAGCFTSPLESSRFRDYLTDFFPENTDIFTEEEIDSIEKMCQNLMLSRTMIHSFYGLMSYYKTTGYSPLDLITPFANEYPLPVQNKTEGKKIYELIRNKVLS